MTTHRSHASEFLWFCAVGVLGFVVDAGVLYASAVWIGWLAGRVLSFLTAASATWWLNRRYTFTQKNPEDQPPQTVGRQYLRYLLSMMAGGLVNYGCYVATLHWLKIPAAALAGVGIGSIAGLGVNFTLARWLVFRRSHARA